MLLQFKIAPQHSLVICSCGSISIIHATLSDIYTRIIKNLGIFIIKILFKCFFCGCFWPYSSLTCHNSLGNVYSSGRPILDKEVSTFLLFSLFFFFSVHIFGYEIFSFSIDRNILFFWIFFQLSVFFGFLIINSLSGTGERSEKKK